MWLRNWWTKITGSTVRNKLARPDVLETPSGTLGYSTVRSCVEASQLAAGICTLKSKPQFLAS